MRKTKTPSENMKKMYSDKKAMTLAKIQNAINDIKEDNRIVTKKELIEITGLSSGTFSKPYVLDLLKENKVCQFKDRPVVISEKINRLEIITISDLNKKINKLERKISLLSDKNEILINRLNQKEIDYENLQTEYKKLKGRYQVVLEKLDIMGFQLDKKIYN